MQIIKDMLSTIAPNANPDVEVLTSSGKSLTGKISIFSPVTIKMTRRDGTDLFIATDKIEFARIID
jgi:hypothetical protein